MSRLIIFLTAAILLTLPSSAAATPVSATCTVKSWHGQPYAFCAAHTCVSIDNTANRIEWMTRNRTGATTYRDVGRIVPARPIPMHVRPAYLAALTAMQHGPRGAKLITVCRD